MKMELSEIVRLVLGSKRLAALTGAGVSTLCGLPDFRGPQGLYRQPDAERIFDIDWFDRDPSIYYRGARELVYGLERYEPGPVHRLLAELERLGILMGVATQNIDMLHQKAGSKAVYEVHGSPLLHHCRRCGRELPFDAVCTQLKEGAVVAKCVCGGAMKPDITFFGEALPEAAFVAAQKLANEADVMLVLGTSLTVFPAAGLPSVTLRAGGRVVVVNAQPTAIDGRAAACFPDLKVFAEACLQALQAG